MIYYRGMKKILIANWKMNPDTTKKAQKLFKGYTDNISAYRGVDVVVCPPSYYLQTVRSVYKGKGLLLGGQTISAYPSGSHTGETSVAMLLDSKCSHVILGHSEQRNLAENNEGVNIKAKLAIKNKIIPIVCIGESVRDDDAQYLFFIKRQLTEICKGLKPSDVKKIVIAYEPIWAIGAKEPMQGHEMHQMVLYIRKVLTKLYSASTALNVPVIYGGSINESNVSDMRDNGHVDGLIVGRASLDPGQIVSLSKALK